MTGAATGWGVLGAGRVATQHFIPALEAAAADRMVVLGSRRPDVGVPYEQVLADPGVDAVYIALPNSMHHDWILACLEAGKHVLCEKPLVLSLEELDGVSRAAAAGGRVVMEAFRYRFNPQYAHPAWGERLEAVGEPRAAHARGSILLRRDGDIRTQAVLGGGALWDIGCYCLSLLTWQFGEPDDVRAVRHEAAGIDRSGAAVLGWRSGFEATSWWSFDAARAQSFALVGERGELHLPQPFWEPSDMNCFLREIEHFGAVVRGEAEPAITLDDTRSWLRVAERVRAEGYPSPRGRDPGFDH